MSGVYIYRVPRYMGNVIFESLESLVWLSTVCTGVDVRYAGYGHGCTGMGCIQGLR